MTTCWQTKSWSRYTALLFESPNAVHMLFAALSPSRSRRGSPTIKNIRISKKTSQEHHSSLEQSVKRRVFCYSSITIHDIHAKCRAAMTTVSISKLGNYINRPVTCRISSSVLFLVFRRLPLCFPLLFRYM